MGFARRHNVPVESLDQVVHGKKRYVAARVHEKGLPADLVLGQSLPNLISKLRFTKSMRWRPGNQVAYSRPIRWLVALLGKETVPFRYADLTSGRTSRGLQGNQSRYSFTVCPIPPM